MLELTPKFNTNFSDCDLIKGGEDNLVLFDGEHYFKITKFKTEDPTLPFNLKILETLAEVHREIGVDWSFETFLEEDFCWAIEKRPKLHVLHEGEIEKSDLLRRTCFVRNKVEKRLEFPRLTAQIDSNSTDGRSAKMVIARDVDFEFEDYAIFGDHILWLGQTNMFLALIGADGKWNKTLHSRTEKVKTSYGDFYFSDFDTFNYECAIDRIYVCIAKWWLFPTSIGDLCARKKSLEKEYAKMLSDDLRVLIFKQPIALREQQEFGPMKESL